MPKNHAIVVTAVWMLITAVGFSTTAWANINIELRPQAQTVLVGSEVRVGLYAVSDDPEMDQRFLAADVILNWDPTKLRLLGVLNDGPYVWLYSGFPFGDVDGLNETFADGDALYTALGQLGVGAWATPAGLRMTTLRFEALAETPGTAITIAEDAGTYTHTSVWGGPGLDVVGLLGDATVIIESCTVPPFDHDGDRDVDLRDFTALQVCFTDSGVAASITCQCAFDADGDQDVDLIDYAAFAAQLAGPTP